jgi:short-subunit dehydrogenase
MTLPSESVVVITGASAGVGRALTRIYAERGARLGLLARGRAGLEAAREDAERLGSPKALAIPTDVADPQQVEAAAAQVDDQLGTPDVWVNNAMTAVFAPVRETTAEEFARVTAVTYLGVVNGTLAALRRMLPRDAGTIVQVGSALAYRGIPLQATYCGAKHAIQGFCDSLRAELLHDRSGVQVSMVQLPAVNTTQFGWVRSRMPNNSQPVPPIYQPEVAAAAIVWAAEHAPRELNVGFSTVLTRLGNKVMPGLLDRYLGKTGYDSQQTDQRKSPERPDNLFEPVDDDRDYGAHGDFDDRSKDSSPALWAVTHKPQLASALLGAGLLAWAGRQR